MKSKILFSIFITILLTGCKKEITNTKTIIATDAKSAIPQTECYSYNGNGNKIELQLHVTSDSVSGTLNYSLAEKDSNTGTLKGKLVNNVLIADYTFQSEGMESLRQAAFKLKDNKWIEGYGEMTKDGTHFKDVAHLKFTPTMPLSKINCSN